MAVGAHTLEPPAEVLHHLDGLGPDAAARLRVVGLEVDDLELAAGVWDEVAALDPFALEKALAEGKWGPDVLERIKVYVSTEKRYTVTLKEES